jgi:elongation factor Ts
VPSRIYSYVHTHEKIGALVEIDCIDEPSLRTHEFRQLAIDIAMQVAASEPIVVDPSGLTASDLNRELWRFDNALSLFALPLEERLAEFELAREKYERILCLSKQPFIRDDSITVEQRIAEVSKELSEKISVVRFVRMAAGTP